MADRREPRALWRVILVVSLCLNVAIVGIAAGVALSGKRFGPPPPRMTFGLGPVTNALDSDERRQIARDVRRKLGGGFAPRLDLQLMVDALTAEPFDPLVLRGLMQQQNDQAAEVVSAAQEAFVNRVTQMSKQERERLAERISKGRRP